MDEDEGTLEQVLEQDPLLTYAIEDDSDEEVDNEEVESVEERAARKAAEIVAKRVAPTAQPAPIDEETQRILTRIKENPEALNRLFTEPTAPVVQPPQPPAQFDLQALSREAEVAFLDSPAKGFEVFIKGLMPLAQEYQKTQKQIETDTRLGSVDIAIDTYLDRMFQDPLLDDDVQAEVRKIVDKARKANPGALARMSRQEIANSLEEVKAQAYGTVALRRQQRQKNRAPVYSANSQNGSSSTPTLTKDERGFCQSLEAAGLTKKEIRQALKEWREEQRAS